MKRWIVIAVFITTLAAAALAQQRTTFTGSVVIYGSGFNTRTTTNTFSMTLNGRTSPQEAQRLVGVLQSGGQEDLLRELHNSEVGRFSIGGHVGLPISAAVVENVEGGRVLIRAVMERWKGFGELWRGGRSLDYPFSYIEIYINPRTGSGEGTFIAAAKIRWKNNQVEVEDFGTFPGRLIGVQMRGRIS